MKYPAFQIAMSLLILLILWGGPLSAKDGGSAPLPASPQPENLTATLVGGTPPALAAARTDSMYLLGGPGALDGDFQDDLTGLPSMDGWTSEFWNHHRPTYSHVDTFHAQLLDPTTVPNHAMWIGTTFDCAGTRNPGYGNSWDQTVDWYGTVADPSNSTQGDMSLTPVTPTGSGLMHGGLPSDAPGTRSPLWHRGGMPWLFGASPVARRICVP